MVMTETVRLRLVFEDRHMLSKSKKKEGLKRSWVLLKRQYISDVASHILDTFRLHRTCPNGIILSMDGFVLPPFESSCILKDKDIVCVKRKGSMSTANKAVILTSAPHEHPYELPKLLANEKFQEETGGYKTMSEEGNTNQIEDAFYVESKSARNAVSKKRKASKKPKGSSVKRKGSMSTANKAVMLTSAPHEHPYVELPKLLANEKFQEETGGYKTMSEEDNTNQFEDAFYVESKSVRNAVSKKRKASNKPKGSRQKKIKLSSAEKLAVIPDIPVDDNLSSQCQKQANEIIEPSANETRSYLPQDDGNGNLDVSNSLSETKKLPSRSARRKKAKRQWLREQLKLEKLHQIPMPEKDGRQLPFKDSNFIVSDVHQKPVEESDAEDDIVPVEIRPGHIRFEPLGKDQAVPHNQLPVETFQWNGITSKKKGQKWGKEKITFRKGDDYKNSNQECSRIKNAEEKQALISVDFDELLSYTSLPKEGDVIAYRLIELSSSWTPEISSFRVGKISRYDPESNMIWLEPVLEYPFDFGKKVDEEVSSPQSDPCPYGEDGSLEIDYSSLVDVRMVKHGNSESTNAVAFSDALVDPKKGSKGSIDEPVGYQTAMQSCKPHNESEGHIPAKENGEVNVWDEINEALTAKKAQLFQEDGWSKEESSGTGSWSHRALRCSALGPTMAFLRAQNGLKETSQQ